MRRPQRRARRDSSARRLRPWNPPPCRRRDEQPSGCRRRADARGGSSPGARRRPPCGTGLRERCAAGRSKREPHWLGDGRVRAQIARLAANLSSPCGAQEHAGIGAGNLLPSSLSYSQGEVGLPPRLGEPFERKEPAPWRPTTRPVPSSRRPRSGGSSSTCAAHRRAEHRSHESRGVLPQLPIELDEGRRRRTRADVEGRKPRGDLRHALRGGEPSTRRRPPRTRRPRSKRPGSTSTKFVALCTPGMTGLSP